MCWRRGFPVLLLALGVGAPLPSQGQAARVIDLASVGTDEAVLRRVHGSTGVGTAGVPVAGGLDADGDGLPDLAFSAMQADPFGRNRAGEVYLVFGDGSAGGSLDTGVPDPDILILTGAGPDENAGSELWMDDVTGDGIADLLIARQNHRPDAARPGAGALSILVGGPGLRTHAATLQPIDLAAPLPAGIAITTLVGAAAVDRLGIWMRSGDVTGDGTADLLVGADQEDGPGTSDRGAAYLVRGGAQLALTQTVDLADFGATALAGDLMKILPEGNDAELHFGSTCQITDLDDNQRGEVLIGAGLNRAGAGLPADGAPAGSAHATGGSADGTVWIAWDDNFPQGAWPAGWVLDLDLPAGSRTVIDGGVQNSAFGEELVGGSDWDDDGTPDLFVGDLTGDGSPGQTLPNSGLGHVLYDAASLRDLDFSMDALPAGLVTTTFFGAGVGHIAGDTAAVGDFDGDGLDDLMFSSPHASPNGRTNAGLLHVFFGQPGAWPLAVDLAALPSSAAVSVTEVWGANGRDGSDEGDVLCYSAAAGDLDGDGRTDLVTNEMVGNGIGPSAEDVGNAIALSGALLAGVPACDDSLDRDGDGLADYPEDPGCARRSSRSENPDCDDGEDNDADGGIDWDGLDLNGDLDFDDAGESPPDPECAVGWRGVETMTAASSCGLGPELVGLLLVLGGLAGRRRWR